MSQYQIVFGYPLALFAAMSTSPIVIVDYDPQWPTIFEELRARIAAALGELAAAIEHIGSTAVPGLSVKPVIDIDVLLSSADDLPATIERLAPLGYIYRGNLGIDGREAFRQPSAQPVHHLYVCPPDSVEYVRHIAFREYLRAHPESASLYGQLKRSLALQYRHERERYNLAKTELVDDILRRALPSVIGDQELFRKRDSEPL